MKAEFRLFEKRAKQMGNVDLSRGLYGELLNPRTRDLWFIWYQAWKDRAKHIKDRQKRSKP